MSRSNKEGCHALCARCWVTSGLRSGARRSAASGRRLRADADDAKRPRQHEGELDNRALTVVRIRLAPHEKTPMHDLTARLVVWLSDADIRDVFPDGQSDELRRSAGTIDWVPAERHAGENLTDRPIEFLAIIPKAD